MFHRGPCRILLKVWIFSSHTTNASQTVHRVYISQTCQMSNSSCASASVKITSGGPCLQGSFVKRALDQVANLDPVVASRLSVFFKHPVASKLSSRTSCQRFSKLTISFPLKHPCQVIGSDIYKYIVWAYLFEQALQLVSLALSCFNTAACSKLAPLGKSHQELARLRRPRCLVARTA